jgi:hypothetical protein
MRFPARPLSDRCATTFRTPIRGISTGECRFRSVPGTEPEPIRDRKERQTAICTRGFAETGRICRRTCLSWRRRSASSWRSSARRNDSPHTLRNYGADLREFLGYFTPPGAEPPGLAEFDLAILREWLAHLYDRGQKPATIRRKMASARSLFRFLSREHRIAGDPARLLRLPKMPKMLPQVPNAEVTNALVDGSSREELGRPHPARDRLLLELLYGSRAADQRGGGAESWKISIVRNGGFACGARGRRNGRFRMARNRRRRSMSISRCGREEANGHYS